MRLKSILIISAIIALILIVVILPKNPDNTPPEMGDIVEISEETTIELGVDVSESPDFDEETVLDENDVEFYVDENGVKHYTIEAIDSPQLED